MVEGVVSGVVVEVACGEGVASAWLAAGSAVFVASAADAVEAPGAAVGVDLLAALWFPNREADAAI